YNGDANANAIQRFARESKTYVKMGRVPADEQVYFISYYLDGRALDFYNQVVVPDEERWDLEKFFIELFEFCFPADFCNKQRKRLERCYQGPKDIAAHVAEWSEIWNTIGLEDTQEKVVRLFNSFTYVIQGEIYRKGYDPEESTWDEILKAAEQAEILLKLVSKNQDAGPSKRLFQSSQRTTSDMRLQGGPSRPLRGGFRGRGCGRGGRFNGAPHPREEILRTLSVGVPGKPERAGEQMSPQRRNEMLAKGLCFICSEAGHLARNCPKNNTVPSKKKGKPPGFSTHAVRLQSGSTSCDALYESMEVLETLHVGAILAGVEEGGESIPILETFSNSNESFDLISELCSNPDREDSPEPHVIGDFPEFMPALWYAQMCSSHLGLDSEEALKETRYLEEIGDAEVSAVQILLERRAYSEEDSIFTIEHEVWADGGDIKIAYHDQAMVLALPRSLLQDPAFNLSAWVNIATCDWWIKEPDAESEYESASRRLGDVLGSTVAALLDFFQPYPGDEQVPWSDDRRDAVRFCVLSPGGDALAIEDAFFDEVTVLPLNYIWQPLFHLIEWFARQHAMSLGFDRLFDRPEPAVEGEFVLHCGVAQIPTDGVKGFSRTVSMPRVTNRVVARPLVIVVRINGEPIRALVDSGSLGDLILSSVADQLRLNREELDDPITLQLAVQGSRSKINHSVEVKFSYQDITEKHSFYVANLSGYDMILGTAWLFQHKVSIGINPARVCIGSADAVPLQVVATARVFAGAAGLSNATLQSARDELLEYAKPICKTAAETGLPPFRAINHTIPLLDENKIYPWQPSRCPEALRPQWDKEHQTYLKAGRWEVSNSGNTCPMLLIPK
ncbi:hypothetical protein B0H17DRAFT_852020, partial [Mycena rosella]